MYCPVDGMEYREGITRCPQHDVPLVDEAPEIEEEPGILERLDLEGAAGIAVVVVAVTSLAWAISAIFVNGWFALAASRDWEPPGVLDVFHVVQGAAGPIALGTLGFLGAALMSRGFARLGGRTPEAETEEPAPSEDGPPELTGAAGWIVTLLTSLVVVFVIAWIATGIAVSIEQIGAEGNLFPGSPFEGPSDSYLKLSALNDAAYTCGFGALVTLAALLMARAYDRVDGIR